METAKLINGDVKRVKHAVCKNVYALECSKKACDWIECVVDDKSIVGSHHQLRSLQSLPLSNRLNQFSCNNNNLPLLIVLYIIIIIIIIIQIIPIPRPYTNITNSRTAILQITQIQQTSISYTTIVIIITITNIISNHRQHITNKCVLMVMV